MIKSVTLAELPRAGSNSKTYHYKQIVQKLTDFSKTWVSTRNQFEDFRRKKEQKQNSRPFRKQPVENTPP